MARTTAIRRFRRSALTLAAACGLLAVAGCDTDEPDVDQLFNRVAFLAPEGDGSADGASVEARLIEAIGGAERSVYLAFEDLRSEAVAQALIDAQARGVDVRVVSDLESAGQAGFVALAAGLAPDASGELPLRFGDGPLEYSPMPTVTLYREGDMNRMTHNFVVIDERRVINLTGGLPPGPPCADPDGCLAPEVRQIGFNAVSEDIAKDFGDEFGQMYGGVFSTTLDTFNGPQKSDANPRTHYLSNRGDLEIYFGPQERLLKRVIDEIYAAKASVYVTSEEFANSFAAEALIYKVSAGFNVAVAMEPDGQECEIDAECPNRQVCEQGLCEVPFNQVDRLRTGFEDARLSDGQTATVGTLPNIRQTVIVIDAEPSPINGRQYKTKVMVLSQPFTSAVSYTRGQANLPRPSDGFMDSNMWVLNGYPSEDNPDVETLVGSVRSILAEAEEAAP